MIKDRFCNWVRVITLLTNSINSQSNWELYACNTKKRRPVGPPNTIKALIIQTAHVHGVANGKIQLTSYEEFQTKRSPRLELASRAAPLHATRTNDYFSITLME